MQVNLARIESIRKGTRMIDPGAKKVSIRCHEHRHDRCRGDLGEPNFKCECECHNEVASTLRQLIKETMGPQLAQHRKGNTNT